MDYKLIWIDDECEARASFADECEDNGFDVTSFTNAEEGMAYYRDHHLEIDALILDAKMFARRNSDLTDLTGLSACKSEIARLEGEYKKKIPYVVYTGQADLQDDDSFRDLVGVSVFSKNEDNLGMFKQLKELIADTPEATLKQRYSALYRSCFDGPMDTQVWTKLVPLLLKLEEHEVIGEYNSTRQVLEAIFHSIAEHGLLPTEMGSNLRLTEVSKFLAGEPSRTSGVALSQPLPKSVTNQIRYILDVSQTGSHQECTKDGSLRFRISDLTRYIGGDCRLANILVLMTADIATWFAGLLMDAERPYKVVHLLGPNDLREEGEASYNRGKNIWTLNTGREWKLQWEIPKELAQDASLAEGNRYWCVVTTKQLGRGRKVAAIHSSEQTS